MDITLYFSVVTIQYFAYTVLYRWYRHTISLIQIQILFLRTCKTKNVIKMATGVLFWRHFYIDSVKADIAVEKRNRVVVEKWKCYSVPHEDA